MQRTVAVCGAVVVAVLLATLYPHLPTGHTGVLFYHTNSSHEARERFEASREGVEGLDVGSASTVFIIVHGYTESSLRTWVVNLTNALLAHEPGSVVILVDYFDLTTISRPYMMENCRHIAQVTAAMVDLLVLHGGVRLSKVHMLGFSLGGRISGLVGARLTTGRLGRITGIDASSPWLPPKDHTEFLDASDAQFVVHLRTSPVGSHSPPGHLDFYANDGLSQPGCRRWYLPTTVETMCSHYRGLWLLVEAVRRSTELFPALQCSGWQSFLTNTCDSHSSNYFSLNPNSSVLGSFYFTTAADPPYLSAVQPDQFKAYV